MKLNYIIPVKILNTSWSYFVVILLSTKFPDVLVEISVTSSMKITSAWIQK
jgi:hypothetical protein